MKKKLDFSQLIDEAPEFDLAELLESGAHFGHQASKWHPMMSQFIYMEKDGVHIFDLAKTASQLRLAYNFAFDLGKKKKTLLMVGTKRQAREFVMNSAKDAGAMFITSRWLGGLFTNWEQVSKSINRMIKIEKGLQNNEYDALTKYERVQLEKEVNRLKRFFDGIRDLSEIPDAIFVVDSVREDIAVKDANSVGVPIVALLDSNADPRLVDIAIPANDDAMGSIKYIVEAFAAGYKAGRASK
jgi:small subunit ribosomal protein S2